MTTDLSKAAFNDDLVRAIRSKYHIYDTENDQPFCGDSRWLKSVDLLHAKRADCADCIEAAGAVLESALSQLGSGFTAADVVDGKLTIRTIVKQTEEQ